MFGRRGAPLLPPTGSTTPALSATTPNATAPSTTAPTTPARATRAFGDGAGPSSRRRPRPNARRRRAQRVRLRKIVAAVLAGVAAFVTLSAVARDRVERPGVAAVVTVHAVPAGAVVTGADVEVVTLAPELRAERAFTASGLVVGRTTAVGLDAREVVTPARLLGGDLLAGQPRDHVAMTVPVLAGQSAGAEPGTHVDLYATGTGERAAGDVVVLARSPAPGATAASTFGQAEAPTVTLALDAAAATRVAKHLSVLGAGESFVVAIRHPGG